MEIFQGKIQLPVILIHLVADRQPLAQVLRDLAAQSDQAIVVDPRMADKAKTAITATLLNASLESALFALTEMADLRPVRMDGLYFVTSRTKAKAVIVALARCPRTRRLTRGFIGVAEAAPRRARRGVGLRPAGRPRQVRRPTPRWSPLGDSNKAPGESSSPGSSRPNSHAPPKDDLANATITAKAKALEADWDRAQKKNTLGVGASKLWEPFSWRKSLR